MPAINAAVTWPVKIASGKFHGDIATNTPRPRSRNTLLSPVGPGMVSIGAEQVAALRGVVAAEIRGLADFRERVIERFAALALQQRDEARRAPLQEVGGLFQDFRARLGRRPAPA